MTTPTPDKGALERAREIFRLMTSSSNPNDHITALAAALTAAEAKARDAAIACCSPKADEAWTREAARTGELIAERIGALATPAQSET